MERYIHDENLKLFRLRLAEATDETQRQTLQVLIEEEEAKIPDRPSPDRLEQNQFRPDA
jgi:hypothetical protein